MQKVKSKEDGNASYIIFPSPVEVADHLASEFITRVQKAVEKKTPLAVAVSGGNSPGLFFSLLAEKFYSSVDWSFVKFFWVDERCVPPDNEESNYGMTYKLLLGKIAIPEKNILRMYGENDPEKEAARYSSLLAGNVKMRGNFPSFDLVILGMGDDGHTASIFPGDDRLLNSNKICETAVHPVSGRKRISLTAKVINNSDEIFFLVTGSKKSKIVYEIFSGSAISANYPASHIKPEEGNVLWLLDTESGKLIPPSSKC